MKHVPGIAALILAAASNSALAWEALPQVAPSPADNPSTPAKVELGQMLYFDPRYLGKCLVFVSALGVMPSQAAN